MIKTKFGNATISSDGYYKIVTRREGNYSKSLHRLIFEDFYKVNLNEEFSEPYDVHHIDGDKTNNEIWNLEPVAHSEHIRAHSMGNSYSLGIVRDEEFCRKVSKTNTTTSYYRVTKDQCPSCNQGFLWLYRWTENGKRKSIRSSTLEKLKEKVLLQGLPWERFDKTVN